MSNTDIQRKASRLHFRKALVSGERRILFFVSSFEKINIFSTLNLIKIHRDLPSLPPNSLPQNGNEESVCQGKSVHKVLFLLLFFLNIKLCAQ